MAEGKLLVIGGKTLQVKFINAKGKEVSFNIKESELSPPLLEKKKNAIAQLDGLEVEFEEVGGQPQQLREKGKKFENSPSGDFHNPYNFVPALPRNTEKVKKSELGDRAPSGHDSYKDDLWSGKISVTLTTVTPLLIPDAAEATEDDKGHKTYDIRMVDGKPYLPPTSIKGMLRSAYEAVTNSRLSVFVKHEDRLAFRMPTNLGIQMVPARIEKDNNGNKVICLLPGTSSIQSDGTPSPNLMYAAWLPRYWRGKISSNAIKYPSGQLPEHQHEVEAWVEKFQHSRWDKRSNQHIDDFQYWRVRKIVLLGDTLEHQPSPTSQIDKKEGYSHHKSLGTIEKICGFVCITNPNIDRKHDERVFFNNGIQILKVLHTDELEKLEKQWKNLITNYQEIHEDEICKKHKDSPPALTNSAWSRHIKGTGYSLATHERTLDPDTLCYARVRKSNNEYEILGLYPVIIAKELFAVNPLSLLSEELRPATQRDKLSPADRVFGWVNQDGKGSYKGCLRVNTVQCSSNDSVENFGDNGFPLAILGQPKPQQARFYIAKDNQGTPLDKGIRKEDSYQSNYSLRGRKVYPHHSNLPAQYWKNPVDNRPQEGHFQEYRRPQKNNAEQRDDQNRSIKAWVKPNTTFSFNIDVTNLSDIELGALLWLLSLPEGNYHRLGGGKPLGFGSAKLIINWDKTDLRKGEAWRDFYSSLTSVLNSSPRGAEAAIKVFKDTVAEVYGNSQSFEQIRFIQAFTCGCQGFSDNKPVHYPRKRQQQGQNPVPPHPDGETFKWFVENERIGTPGGLKVSLPELWNETGLPYFDLR